MYRSQACWLSLALSMSACGPAALQGRVQRDVPWIPQPNPSACARAAAESVAAYYGSSLSAEGRRLLEAEEASSGSASAGTLKRALEASGFQVSVFAGSWDSGPESLLKPLRLGRPLLVLLENSAGHFVLLSGFDGERDTVFVVDPLRGPRELSRKAFNRGWKRARRLTVLAVPRSATAGSLR